MKRSVFPYVPPANGSKCSYVVPFHEVNGLYAPICWCSLETTGSLHGWLHPTTQQPVVFASRTDAVQFARLLNVLARQ